MPSPKAPLVDTKAPVSTVGLSMLHDLIAGDASGLSQKLQDHRMKLFPPKAEKTLRRFSSTETAKIIGIADSYLRTLSLEGKGPAPETTAHGRRSYSFSDIRALREFLDESGKGDRRYLPQRKEGQHLQVICVANFKGGSAKTTTSAHLSQYLALRGYRVLAVDLDPQASLTALHGYQPEFDVGADETLYGAIKYGPDRRPTAEVIKETYFPGLHLIPGNIELMEFEHESPRAISSKKDTMFFARISQCLAEVEDRYDVVILDCPPQLGFLTLSALCASTALLVTVHPEMLDIMSMCQFLLMTSELLEVVAKAGGNMQYDWMRYLVTRYEPTDGPQTQMVGFMRSLFGDRVLTSAMVKSTAISDASMTKQTLYEVTREQFTRSTYDRALESMNQVNAEIESLIEQAWGN
ncbi:MAG: plasmid partitioning protein RepA [Rhodospirillales bacterium]|nr:plasmid partitioning protein RepA [Rhodospirillales bacterium]